jgi:hypothetical protein
VALASLRRDGTLRKPVTIWGVRHGDDRSVRSGNGRTSAWFRGTQDRREGRIRAGDLANEVSFVAAEEEIDADRDAAYRTKSRRDDARFVDPMMTPGVRAATLKLVPRENVISDRT